MEVNLQIPGIKGYNEDTLLLVITSTTYSKKVQIMVGSIIIDWAMEMMTKGELVRATAILETGSLQCSYVLVTPVALHNFKGRWRSQEGGHYHPML